MSNTDTDMLARHLIDVWGYAVKVDDVPDELVVPFALQTLQQAATELSAIRARVNALEVERLAIATSVNVTLDNGAAPDNLAQCVELLMLQEYHPAMSRNDALQNRVNALEAAVTKWRDAYLKLEFDEITGECLMDCGGDAATGHNEGCKFIQTIPEDALEVLRGDA